MIIQIDKSSTIQKTLQYNLEKCETIGVDGEPTAIILNSNNYEGMGKSPRYLFDKSEERNLNPRLKQKYLHIKVSLSPEDQVSNLTMKKISNDVLNGLHFNPLSNHHIVFRHFDTEHPHIHIALSRTDVFGNTNPLKFYKYKSRNLAQELEKKYNLTPAWSRKLNTEEIRVKTWSETKVEDKVGVQSKIQVLRDLVSETLDQSSSLNDYLFNLHRKGVSIRFRVEKKEDESLTVGLSYNISPELGPKIKTPALPVYFEKQEASELMEKIINNGYAFNGEDKIYMAPNRQVRMNSNPLPVEVLDEDYSCRASDLGPGAEWYKLKERFPESTQDYIFEDDLVPEKAKGKRENVWYLESTDLYDAEETVLDQKFLLGIKEKTPSYILEAVEEGLDPLEVLNYHVIKLNAEEKDVLYGILELNEREELSYDAVASLMIGESPEPNESVLAETLAERPTPTETKVKYSIEELSLPVEELFMNGRAGVLEQMLDEGETLFIPLLSLLTPDNIKQSGLELSLVDRIKGRVAAELSTDSEFVKVTQHKLDKYVFDGNEHLDLFVRMGVLDFTKVENYLNNIKDEKLRAHVEDRIINDKLYNRNLVQNLQIKLSMVYGDFKSEPSYGMALRVFEEMENPMVSFSSIDPLLLKPHLPEHQFELIKKRIESDKSKSEELTEYAFGSYLYDRVSGEFFDQELINQIKMKELQRKAEQEKDESQDQDNDIDLDSKKDKGSELNF